MHTRNPSIVFLFISILIAFMSRSAIAHEFWIQPSKIIFDAGQLLSVQLMHGERFNGHVVPINEPQIHRYEFIESVSSAEKESTEMNTTEVRYQHMSETGYLRPSSAGVIVYESKHYTSTLSAERFNAYLKEEKLDHILQERIDRDESQTPGNEIYARYAKSILHPEGSSTSTYQTDHVVGLPLEIVIESVRPGDAENEATVHAQLLFQESPIQGLRVVAVDSDDPTTLLELESDADGRIEFACKDQATMMLTTLHMARLNDQNDQQDIQWESFWSSTVFTANQ